MCPDLAQRRHREGGARVRAGFEMDGGEATEESDCRAGEDCECGVVRFDSAIDCPREHKEFY